MSMGFVDLLKLAEGDFKTSVDMERSFPDEYAVRSSAYHLQQAVEKVLKAVILYNGETPPFTHDIGRLADQCSKLGISFDNELENIADTLTLWESKCRYDPYITFTLKKYNAAKQAYIAISQKLRQEITQNNDADLGMKM